MNKLIIASGVVLVLAVGAGAYYLGSKSTDKDLESAKAEIKTLAAPRVGDAPPSPAIPSIPVYIRKGSFEPVTVTIKKGTEVVWMNTDTVAHTVTSDDGGITLNSQSIAAGHAFAHIFTDTGTVNYHCAVDRAMKGVVVVEDK